MKLIGVYGIFLGKYIAYLKEFLEHVSECFTPDTPKRFFIVTDKPVDSGLTAEFDVVQVHTPFIGWPYETLYRFVYFQLFPTELVDDCDTIFFMNSNIVFRQHCDSEVFPDKTDHVFVLHRCQSKVSDTLKSNSMETWSGSTCYLSPRKTLRYIIGGFFGATTLKFKNLCARLAHDVFVNESNNHIAVWHDETHLNFYVNTVLQNNVKLLTTEYHGYGRCEANKIDFRSKPKALVAGRVHRNGQVIPNPYFKSFSRYQDSAKNPHHSVHEKDLQQIRKRSERDL